MSPNSTDLFQMSDEEILMHTDPLLLSRLTALGVKRICGSVMWQLRGVWAVIAILVSVCIVHGFK
jgi:hypothetical protein